MQSISPVVAPGACSVRGASFHASPACLQRRWRHDCASILYSISHDKDNHNPQGKGVHTARERKLGCQQSRGYAAGKVKDEEHELARLEGQSMAARFLSKHRPTTVSSPLEQVRVGVPPKALTMALRGTEDGGGGGWAKKNTAEDGAAGMRNKAVGMQTMVLGSKRHTTRRQTWP